MKQYLFWLLPSWFQQFQENEVVELFVGDVYASIIPPVKRLRGFKKISLQPGEISTVSFTLNKGDLSLINRKLERITEPDNFKVYVNNLTTKFYLK